MRKLMLEDVLKIAKDSRNKFIENNFQDWCILSTSKGIIYEDDCKEFLSSSNIRQSYSDNKKTTLILTQKSNKYSCSLKQTKVKSELELVIDFSTLTKLQ